MKLFTTINEFKQSLKVNESKSKSKKLNYTDGKKFYYLTFENGLYWFVYDENGKTAYTGNANEEKEDVIKAMNLKRVPVKDQKTIEINESNDNIDWKLQNPSSSLKFIYPPKPDSLTKKFLDFVYQNPGSTKAEFYKFINRQLTPGNNAHFFAGIKDAGLVELVGNKYYIGQNYGKWTQNKLSTNPSKAPSYYDKIRKFNESKGIIHGFTLDDLKLLGFKSKEDFKEKLTKAAKEDQKYNKLPLSVCKEDNIKVYHDELKSIKKKQNINESLVKVINVTEEDLDIFKSHTGLNCVIEDGMIVYEEGLDMFALVKHSDGTFILMKYNDTLDEYEELPGLYDVRLNKIS